MSTPMWSTCTCTWNRVDVDGLYGIARSEVDPACPEHAVADAECAL